MMRFSPKLKKILLIGTIVLLGCDVSMLFAAENTNQTSASANESNPQLQQLQAQVQAQIKALQNGSAEQPTTTKVAANDPAPPPVPPTPSANQQVANALVGPTPPPAPTPAPQQRPDLLPPSPFTTPVPSAEQTPANIPPPAYQGQVALPQAPASTAQSAPGNVSQGDINETAFNSMVQNALPMSTDQIQKLRSVYMASQFAAANTPGTPPRPTATSVFVDLSPGSTPPVVRLAQGFVTSLVFVDSTGAPWPIEAYDIGNPAAFNIQWDKTSNTLMIQAAALYTYGNLAVKLKGLDTPVMVTLIPGQKAVDYRVDMRVQGYGPNAKPFQNNGLPSSTSSDLLNVLDGVPPANSKVLKVENGDCQAWLAGDKMYVRTRLSVLSPGWVATLSSADGMHAYQMQPTPMLLVSQNGQVIQLKVEGF